VLKRAPVFGKAFGTDVEGDGGAGADVADGALAELGPLLLDLLVELLEALGRVGRVVQQAPSLLQLHIRLRNVLLIVATLASNLLICPS
jgi:hypothetical protein